jgi:hypothetical protein
MHLYELFGPYGACRIRRVPRGLTHTAVIGLGSAGKRDRQLSATTGPVLPAHFEPPQQPLLRIFS